MLMTRGLISQVASSLPEEGALAVVSWAVFAGIQWHPLNWVFLNQGPVLLPVLSDMASQPGP